MKEKKLTRVQFDAFVRSLQEEEREPATIEKYLRDIRAFMVWADSREINKELTAAWKDHLKKSGLQPEAVNSKLSALNRFFSFLGWKDCRVKYLKIQHRLFRRADRDLTKEEYRKLFDMAVSLGKDRLALMMETICATGIRVSEEKYITVEAARVGRADISLKGKIRTILIPGKLCRKLQSRDRQKAENRLRRDISHQKRKGAVPQTDLGGTQSIM